MLLCKSFLRIISIKLFVIWQVLKPALQKLNLEGFFQNPKMAKSYLEPIFINKFLKPERVICSKC